MKELIKNGRSLIGRKLNGRDKKFAFSSLSSLLAKLINVGVSIVSLPLILHTLGKEKYGIMLTITSISALINFADFGLGFGLQNKIPILANKKDKSLHYAISSTFFFLIAIALLFVLIFFFADSVIDWSNILNQNLSQEKNDINNSVSLFFVCMVLVIPFSVVQKIQIGFQKGYITNFWITAGNIFSLIVLFIVSRYTSHIWLIVLSIYGTNSIFICLNFLDFFFRTNRSLKPRISYVKVSMLKGTVIDSTLFFLVQFLGIILFVSNNYLINYYYGSIEVADFNIVFKLAVLFMIPVEAVAPYITPAVNEAIANADSKWIKSSFKKIAIVTLAFSLCTGISVYYFGEIIMQIWLGKDVVISNQVLLSVAMFISLYSSLGSILSYIMLTSRFIKQKALIYTIAVSSTICAKIILVREYSTVGAFWSTTVPMFVLYIIPCMVLLYKKVLLTSEKA